MILIAIFIIVILIVVFLYWQLIITEGAYLGAPTVALLYNWTAERYNKIKEFDEVGEQLSLGAPLANRLHAQPQAMVLDVATGTGRIPLRLLKQPHYQGHIIGVDRAAKMLAVARRDIATYTSRVTLIQADVMALPFATNSLPMVTCLEAMEFFPNPKAGLLEMVRVLQTSSPTQQDSGWLVTTNRIGWETRLMPGKAWTREQLEEILAKLPLEYVDIEIWQDIYNLVWAKKYTKIN